MENTRCRNPTVKIHPYTSPTALSYLPSHNYYDLRGDIDQRPLYYAIVKLIYFEIDNYITFTIYTLVYNILHRKMKTV